MPVELGKELTQLERETGQYVATVEPFAVFEHRYGPVAMIDGHRSRPGVDLPDERDALREELAALALHLLVRVRLAQDLDDEVGCEGRDRLVGDLSVGEA